MTRRLVAVLPPPVRDGFPPPALRSAMVEDVYEMVASLERVEAVLLVGEDDSDLEQVVWPGTPIVSLGEPDDDGRYGAVDVFDALGEMGADEATLVSGDAPDLPPLLVGKLHRGLGSADVAAIPARDGDLTALAVRLPLSMWARTVVTGLDGDRGGVHPLPLDALRLGAPRRVSLSIAPGWHRVRASGDLDRLDPGLEGWEVTRAYVTATRPSRPPGPARPAG